MGIGLETAKQETGKTSVTGVEREATLKETAKIVLKSSGEKCNFFSAYMDICFWLMSKFNMFALQTRTELFKIAFSTPW